MLSFLWPWSRKKKRDARQLFPYFDGTRDRLIDPTVAAEGLDTATDGQWVSLLRVIATPPPEPPKGVDTSAVDAIYQKSRMDAAKKVADACCAAFRVEEANDEEPGSVRGLSRPERIALVTAFFWYLLDVKENARPF